MKKWVIIITAFLYYCAPMAMAGDAFVDEVSPHGNRVPQQTKTPGASSQESPNPSDNRWLLAIGVQKFVDTRIAKLTYTARDAMSIRDYFVADRVPADHIRLLVDEDATKDNILNALEAFRKRVGPSDTFFLFYSSHGVGDQEGRTFFVTFDTVMDELGQTALPMQQIKDTIHKFGCENVILMVDTCHSGGVKSLKRPHEESFDKILRAAGKKTRIAILTSSRTHESSLESPEWGHGVFTYFLLKGLTGESDNFPKDEHVSVTELFDYIMVAVPRATDRAQHPSGRFSYNWPKEKTKSVRVGKITQSIAPKGRIQDTPVGKKIPSHPQGWESIIDTPAADR